MRKDSKTILCPTPALNPQAISSDTTTDGTTIDLKGYHSCLFAIQSATITDGTYTPVIEEDATGLFTGSETAVADADLTNTEANTAFAAGDDNEVKTIGYKGSVRYIRLTLVSASTSTGGTLGAIAIKGDPEVMPTPGNDA